MKYDKQNMGNSEHPIAVTTIVDTNCITHFLSSAITSACFILDILNQHVSQSTAKPV